MNIYGILYKQRPQNLLETLKLVKKQSPEYVLMYYIYKIMMFLGECNVF